MLTIVNAALSLNMGLRAPVTPRAVAPSMNFYTVFHEFKVGKTEMSSDEFWGAIAGVDMAEMAKGQHESGIFNHYFMPGAVDGPMMCLWECKDKEMGSDAFKAFIDGPESPAGGLLNKVYPISDMGMTPASAWPTMPAPGAKSAGSFFWVKHTFNEGTAEGFWENMATIDMDEFAAANKKKGFCNHLFMPTTDPSTVFCVWESKAPMTAEEFAVFMDGPDGPAPGVFTNAVYPVMEGGTTPPAAFPISWMDETMAKIEAFGEEALAKFEEVFKTA
jgi:hypothetical protein